MLGHEVSGYLRENLPVTMNNELKRKNKNVNIKIQAKKSKDLIQVNKRNRVNKYFLKFWRPKTNLHEGINSIINYYNK